MQPMDDTRLIGEARSGDRTAFETLVRRYDRSVLRLTLRCLRSREEARDAYQETFLRLYRTLGEFRHDCSLETWILRIATNVCMDVLRRRAARPEEVAGLDAAPDPAEDRPDHDPDRAFARVELRRRIEAALAGLAPRERMVFEMRHYEGMRLRQIGQVIGTTEETVKNCLFRAHRHLRAALSDLGGARMPSVTARADGAGVQA
jgi:RNA polymerase sigma-70 factor (ECF subfamily)